MGGRDDGTELVADIRIVVELEPMDDTARRSAGALEEAVAAAIHRGLIEADIDQRLENELRQQGLALGDLDAVVVPSPATRRGSRTAQRRPG